MSQKTFKWGYLKKSPDTSGSDPNYFAGGFFTGIDIMAALNSKFQWRPS
jgi:hypothetical protein